MKYIFLVIAFFFLSKNSVAAEEEWSTDLETFRQTFLSDFEPHRGTCRPHTFLITTAVDILDFLNRSCRRYGPKFIAQNEQASALIVDMAYIIQQQSPDFKNRYDFLLEQMNIDGTQISFSLHTFDRIGLIFSKRGDRFNLEDGSAYNRFVSAIFAEELQTLHTTLRTIRDLEVARRRLSVKDIVKVDSRYFDGTYLSCLAGWSTEIDYMERLTKKPQIRQQERLKGMIPTARLSKLARLVAMGMDFYSLATIKVTCPLIGILDCSDPTHREALLYMAFHIGEFTTTKKLSAWIKSKRPHIPWSAFADIRDYIIHQDEHGLDKWFDTETTTPDMLNFQRWAKEFEDLGEIVDGMVGEVWASEEKSTAPTFEKWLEAELAGTPIYGVKEDVEKPSLEKETRKLLRKTPLYKTDAAHWARVTTRTAKITPDTLMNLHAAISETRDQLRAPGLTPKNRQKIEKLLDVFLETRLYFIRRIEVEAVNLTEEEKDILIDAVIMNIGNKDVLAACLGLLTEDPDLFRGAGGREFMTAFMTAGIDYKPFGKIYMRISPKMKTTRRVLETMHELRTDAMSDDERFEFHKHHAYAGGEHIGASLPLVFDLRRRMGAFTHFLPHLHAAKKVEHNRRARPAVDRFEQAMMNLVEPGSFAESGTPEQEWQRANTRLRALGVRVTPSSTEDPEFRVFSAEAMARAQSAASPLSPQNAWLFPVTMAGRYHTVIATSALQTWMKRTGLTPPAGIMESYELMRTARIGWAHGDSFSGGTIIMDPEDFTPASASGAISSELRYPEIGPDFLGFLRHVLERT